MNLFDYDSTKAGRRWVSCFDRLGFGDYCKSNSLVEVFCATCGWIAQAEEQAEDEHLVEFAWFSDTILFYSTVDSWASHCAVTEVSESFFDEMLLAGVPARGALAFGEFYADKTCNIFIGNALVDAYKYGEKFDWLGFVLHSSALTRMAELGHPLSDCDLWHKRWNTEIRDRKTGRVESDSTVAYLPGKIMPVAGGNPYLAALREMANRAQCEVHRTKYQNTIRFIEHFS